MKLHIDLLWFVLQLNNFVKMKKHYYHNSSARIPNVWINQYSYICWKIISNLQAFWTKYYLSTFWMNHNLILTVVNHIWNQNQTCEALQNKNSTTFHFHITFGLKSAPSLLTCSFHSYLQAKPYLGLCIPTHR